MGPTLRAENDSPFPTATDETVAVVKSEEIRKALKGLPKTSTVFRLTPLSNTAEQNYALIDRERTRLRLSLRYILCEDNYVVVKAMPSHLHERVTRAVEYELKKVLQPYMPNAPGNELRMLGGSKLALGNFRGEADGGLCFPGTKFPFIVLETGVTDTGSKTRGRVRHYLTRATGDISIGIAIDLKSEVDNAVPNTHVAKQPQNYPPPPLLPQPGVAVLPPGQNKILTRFEIVVFQYSNTPADNLVTRNTSHGKVSETDRLNILSPGGRTHLTLDVLPFTNMLGGHIFNAPNPATVQLPTAHLLSIAQEAVAMDDS